MYQVLKPVYTPYFDSYTVSWICMGLAKDMEAAKKLYGGAPILERVKL